MSAWTSTTLGDLFEISRGGSPRPIDQFITDDPDGVNWIMIGDASEQSKYITKTRKRIKPSGVSRSRRVKPGDFLLTNSMSFGRPYILKTDGCIHDGWLVMSPKIEVNPDYFYYLLGSDNIYSEFARLAAGATVKNLNIDLVSSVRVELPSFSEQCRIAAILDQADALRAKRRAALAQLDEMAQAIFEELFGSAPTWPSRWPLRSFEETMRDETSCSNKLQAGQFLPIGKFPVVDQGQSEIAGYCDDPTYLCVSSLPCIVFGDHTRAVKLVSAPFVVGADGAKVLVPREGVNPVFLSYVMRSAPIPNLGYSRHMREVKRMRFPAPPMMLQKEFSRRIASFEVYREKLRDSAKQLELLFASLQHRAFTGAL